jgi:hypothetical protein
METNTAERLEQAVATLNDLIALTRSCELHDSAQFLAMAKLNLLMDLNGITEMEFRALCKALEGETSEAAARRASARPSSARRQRTSDGEDRLLRRTLRGQEFASLHASRTRIKQ